MTILFDEDEKSITGLSAIRLNLDTFQYVNALTNDALGKKMLCSLNVTGQDLKVENGAL
jgi:hypothetical protein